VQALQSVFELSVIERLGLNLKKSNLVSFMYDRIWAMDHSVRLAIDWLSLLAKASQLQAYGQFPSVNTLATPIDRIGEAR
jgi:hypothetical protein